MQHRESRAGAPYSRVRTFPRFCHGKQTRIKTRKRIRGKLLLGKPVAPSRLVGVPPVSRVPLRFPRGGCRHQSLLDSSIENRPHLLACVHTYPLLSTEKQQPPVGAFSFNAVRDTVPHWCTRRGFYEVAAWLLYPEDSVGHRCGSPSR